MKQKAEFLRLAEERAERDELSCKNARRVAAVLEKDIRSAANRLEHLERYIPHSYKRFFFFGHRVCPLCGNDVSHQSVRYSDGREAMRAHHFKCESCEYERGYNSTGVVRINVGGIGMD